ncbi:phage tail protein [Chromobacterium violaceum]|uniref:phage tail protein n=1 Tax=Chromobacterium violaceum TaxID=536 RepID=UPI001FCFA095|nr:phage tail protein [Chromobacterium violaceum]
MQDVMQPINTPDKLFQDGNPNTGALGTIVTATWLNAVQGGVQSIQAELVSLLASLGISPDAGKNTQVLDAVRRIAWGGATRPTTLAGYGITDAASKTDLQALATKKNPVFEDRVTVPEGTVKAPGITFALDGSGDTGFWHISDGFIGIACNGVEAARFGPDGMILPSVPLGTSNAQPASNAALQAAIAALVGSVPATLNTLAKLGDAVNDDPNFATSMANALAGKATKAEAVAAAPPGLIGFFAGPAAPVGWLRANGTAVSRSTYAALFAAIGTLYGAGDGSTTFNLPDLRGEFVRGWDDGARGIELGRALGSNQLDTVGPHDHTVKRLPDGGTLAIPGTGGTSWSYAGSVSSTNQLPLITGANTGIGSETRPRNIALLACIKI